MGISFAIADWAACAPGLAAPSQWQDWARAPVLPSGPLEASLPEMPAMLRRRLAPLGRAAARVAWDCHGGDTGIPLVFASRYGDADRALQLMKDFALTGALSPTDFALSVHNAIGAVYSIARSGSEPYTSIAAGAASAAAGVLEAASLLADGNAQVVLVCYDAPLPGEYSAFADEPPCTYAWAWRMAVARPGEPCIQLAWAPAGDGMAPDRPTQILPFGLDVHRFAISGDTRLARASEGKRWCWSRQHG